MTEFVDRPNDPTETTRAFIVYLIVETGDAIMSAMLKEGKPTDERIRLLGDEIRQIRPDVRRGEQHRACLSQQALAQAALTSSNPPMFGWPGTVFL